jgi:hypothetical protein
MKFKTPILATFSKPDTAFTSSSPDTAGTDLPVFGSCFSALVPLFIKWFQQFKPYIFKETRFFFRFLKKPFQALISTFSDSLSASF